MHRTTTTATLLVTVAVSALSGCTTVPHPSAPTPSTAPSRPSAPQPEGEAETQVVQAPAREALQLIEEVSHRPKPAASPSHPAPTPPAVSPEHGTSQPGHHDARPRPARPERPGPAPHSPQRSHPRAPDVSESVRQDVRSSVPDSSDVCALGRRYGGWRADSPEATICRDTYGR
ncbi:hypothetical protein [Streptomyces luteogriseus]|uniref:hypothetical protein n=1 Tax=Streptomyces luteogriseus TaxID=68233 RepID=UPI002E31BB13|nr:hypothetical protein [Streptomyces luteogriseus]WTJ31909.1 hypothetical protein OID52_35015 [Streptomyces luteogriseus]